MKTTQPANPEEIHATAKLVAIKRLLGERYNRAAVNENKPEVAAAIKAIIEEIREL